MPNCSVKKFLAVLAISAFGLNMLWELAQVSAFSSLDDASLLETLALVTIAGIADAFITLAAYLIVALIRRKWNWIESAGFSDFLIFALLGTVSAILIETVALSRGIWSYGEYMPVIPALEIGLLPFLQLTLLLPAAVWLAICFCRRRKR